MSISEGPFQNIVDIAGGSAFFATFRVGSSSEGPEITFVRYVDSEGVEINFNLGDGFEFLPRDNSVFASGIVPVFRSFDKDLTVVAFPFKAEFRDPLTQLTVFGFTSFGIDGIKSVVAYNSLDLHYVGSFDGTPNKFAYVVIGGDDAGLYTATLQSDGNFKINAYLAALNLILPTSDFNPDPASVAASLELPGDTIAVYRSDPGVAPADLTFGFNKFVSISNNRIVLHPRAVEITEVNEGGETTKSYFMPVITFNANLAILAVKIYVGLPLSQVMSQAFNAPAIVSESGEMRVRYSSPGFGDLYFDSNQDFVNNRASLGDTLGQSFRLSQDNFLRVLQRRFGQLFLQDTAIRFEKVSFRSNQQLELTEEYPSLIASTTLSASVANKGNEVLIARRIRSFFTGKTTVTLTTGNWTSGESFRVRNTSTFRGISLNQYGVIL